MSSIAELTRTVHGNFWVPRGDEWIGASMRQGTHWEEDILNTMLAALPEGGTYVDAGSFVGTHAIPMARKAKHVLTFEPQRHIFQMLCANAVGNGVTNVYPFNCALGHVDRALISMNATVPDGVSRGRALVYGQEGQPINFGGTNMGKGGDVAEMRTLDAVFDQLGHLGLTLDVLKVDVQGAEPLMFHGAARTLATHRPAIFFEIDGRFDVTADMKAMVDIPDEVAAFDIVTYTTKQLNYLPPQQLGPCDWVLYPQ